MTTSENYCYLMRTEQMGERVHIHTRYKGFMASFILAYDKDEYRKVKDDFGNTTFAMDLIEVVTQAPNRRHIVLSSDKFPECENPTNGYSLGFSVGLIRHDYSWSMPDYEKPHWYSSTKLKLPSEIVRWERIGRHLYRWTKEQAINMQTFEGFLEDLPTIGADHYLAIEEN